MEINQNWLAGIIEQDERVVSLEAEIAALREKYAEVQQQLGHVRFLLDNEAAQIEQTNLLLDNANRLLAEQANKLRAYELVESRLWQEAAKRMADKEAKGE